MAKKKISSEEDIFKKYANTGSASTISLDSDTTPWLPSRVIGLNQQLGGGFKYGTIVEGYGLESSGKSFMGSEFAYSAQALGGIVIWIDAELCYDSLWQMKFGINPDDVKLSQTIDIFEIANFIKDALLYYRSKLVNNEPIFVVLDSVAALDVEDPDEEITKGGQMGNRPKALYTMFRLINPIVYRTGAIVYCVNQVRMKLGAKPWEQSETTPGGKALGFFASQRIMFQKSKAIKYGGKSDGQPIGREIIIAQHKSKVAPPSSSYRAYMYFRDTDQSTVGFDKYGGFLDSLKEARVVKMKGSHIYFKGKSIANGKDKFNEVLLDDKKLRSKLISKLGVNTISKTRDKLESSENLFKV